MDRVAVGAARPGWLDSRRMTSEARPSASPTTNATLEAAASIALAGSQVGVAGVVAHIHAFRGGRHKSRAHEGCAETSHVQAGDTTVLWHRTGPTHHRRVMCTAVAKHSQSARRTPCLHPQTGQMCPAVEFTAEKSYTTLWSQLDRGQACLVTSHRLWSSHGGEPDRWAPAATAAATHAGCKAACRVAQMDGARLTQLAATGK